MVTTTCPTSLSQLADSLGVMVRTAPTPAGLWGIYDHRHGLITMRPNLGPDQYRSTLAHELGHAHYGHIGQSAKAERQADIWAARQLLTLDLIIERACVTIDSIGLAAELEVMPWVLRSFISTLSEKQTRMLLAEVRQISA